MKHLTIEETAYQDLWEAVLRYEREKTGLGEAFLEAFDNCCHHILNFPKAFPQKYKTYRQALMKRFPYVIIYEFEDPEIVIYSVFFTDRNPAEKYPE